ARRAIQRGALSRATWMFITATWCGTARSASTARSPGSASRPVTNSVSGNDAAVHVDRLAGAELRGGGGQPDRGAGHVVRRPPAAQRRVLRHRGAERRVGAGAERG